MSDVAMVVQAVAQGAEKVGQVVNTINAIGDTINTVKEIGSNIVSGIKNIGSSIKGIFTGTKSGKSSGKTATAVQLGSGRSLAEMMKNSTKPTTKTVNTNNSGTVQHNTTVKTFKPLSSESSATKTSVAKKSSTVSTSKNNNDWRPVYNEYTNDLKGV